MTSDLWWMTLMLGGTMMALYVLMVVDPDGAIKIFKRFPRNKIAGWVLAAISIAWLSRLLWITDLGSFEVYKQRGMVLFVPLSYAILVFLLDELLAPRALGAILLLAPAPIIHAARFHPSPFRYVVIIIGYIMVIKGIILVLSPFKMRKALDEFITSKERCRMFGIIGMSLASFLIVLALTVFRLTPA